MEIILLVILVGIIFFVFSVYNKLIRMIEAAVSAEKEISVQLDRRGKVFDSLIATVSKYMDHENSVLTKVTELRRQVIQNSDPDLTKQAEQELSKIVSSGQLSSSLNLTVEAYPDLKSNTNMLQLQEEIVSTENKLSFSKKGYNFAVEKYNVAKKSIPDVFIVSMIKSLDREFSYWQLDEAEIKTQEAKRISF